MTTVAIMQPTFLPWLGYFDLIDQVDKFVFLDDVQLVKRSWQRRNQLKGPNGPVMISLEVPNKPSRPLIKDAKISHGATVESLVGKIEPILGQQPFFDGLVHLLENSFAEAGDNLSKLNEGIIRRLCVSVGIKADFHSASALQILGKRSERLEEMCMALGADVYLSPQGSADYLEEDDAFSEIDVSLRFQKFEHPRYPQQHPPFISHMSAVECFATVGPEAFLGSLRQGRRPSITLGELRTQKQ